MQRLVRLGIHPFALGERFHIQSLPRELGLVCQESECHQKNAPYRYWLPAKAAAWSQDPLRQLFEDAERNSDRVLEALRQWRWGLD